jgi:hypothetical protein
LSSGPIKTCTFRRLIRALLTFPCSMLTYHSLNKTCASSPFLVVIACTAKYHFLLLRGKKTISTYQSLQCPTITTARVTKRTKENRPTQAHLHPAKGREKNKHAKHPSPQARKADKSGPRISVRRAARTHIQYATAVAIDPPAVALRCAALRYDAGKSPNRAQKSHPRLSFFGPSFQRSRLPPHPDYALDGSSFYTMQSPVTYIPYNFLWRCLSQLVLRCLSAAGLPLISSCSLFFPEWVGVVCVMDNK